jgi:hypothetical protein
VSAPSKPAATPVGLNADWYEFCAAGELRFQRCTQCARWRHPPRYLCAGCGSEQWSWEPSSRRGTVYTWTVTHQATHPAWAADTPYVVAVIETDEGVRLVGGLSGVEPADVRLGLAVDGDWEQRGDLTLPVWRPAGL